MVTTDKTAPGETGEIKATFNSRNRKGTTSKAIWVHSNDPENPKVNLTIKATVIPTVKFYLFYSEDCDDCEILKKKILPPLERKYRLQIEHFDLDELKNYELLTKLEEKYDDVDNDIPVVVIGEYILSGPKEAKRRLEAIIRQYEESGCSFPSLRTRLTPSGKGGKKVYLAYFYSQGCKECDRITYDLRYLESKYPYLVVKRFDIATLENKKLNEAMCELYEVPQKKRLITPMIFVGDKFLAKKEISRIRLQSLLKEYQAKGTDIPWEDAEALLESSEKSIRDRFEKMSVFTVLSAGLIDGVNPCAIATIVLFISFLSFIGRKGRDLLLVGMVFTSSVYVAYLLIGMGIFGFLRQFSLTSAIGKAVFFGAAFLALIFGILSVHDYFKMRKGRYEEAKLRLPKFLKKKVDATIRKRVAMKNYILAAAVIGFVISVTEFVCTGQVYLPTIAFISGVPHLRLRGLTYLLLYNVAFVVPLMVVFTAAYRGTTSMDLNLFWRKHVKSVRLITAILFFLLAGLLVFYAYH